MAAIDTSGVVWIEDANKDAQSNKNDPCTSTGTELKKTPSDGAPAGEKEDNMAECLPGQAQEEKRQQQRTVRWQADGGGGANEEKKSVGQPQPVGGMEDEPQPTRSVCTSESKSPYNGFDVFPQLAVDSYRVNPELMRQPLDVLMLEERNVLIVDDELGALLLSLGESASDLGASATTTLAESFGGKWKNPKCVCAVRGKQEILILVESIVEPAKQTPAESPKGSEPKKEDANGEKETAQSAPTITTTDVSSPAYNLQIHRFDYQLRLVERVEAPRFLQDKVVVHLRMCHVAETGCIYLAASTPNNAYLYELSPECRWTEVYTARGRSYADVEPLAVVGPVTELLLVEGNRQYVQLVSIYDSQVVAQRMLALAERPDALTIDERGNLFIFDRATSKVGLYSRVYFDKMRDVALVERAHCRISAYGKCLAVLGVNFRELKIYLY